MSTLSSNSHKTKYDMTSLEDFTKKLDFDHSVRGISCEYQNWFGNGDGLSRNKRSNVPARQKPPN
jgi:hypothetical protein